MLRGFCIIIVLVAFGMDHWCAGQQEALTFLETLPIAAKLAPELIFPVKSGPRRELLIRFDTTGDVTVISGDGKQVYQVGISQLPELHGATMLDYAAGPSGNVFLLAAKQYDPGDASARPFYVAKFDDRGNHSL